MYKAEKGTENHVHLEVFKKEFNAGTGLPKFKPYNQILTVKEYEMFLQFPNGLCITKVLHLPKDVKDPKALRAEYLADVAKSKKDKRHVMKAKQVNAEMFDLDAKVAPADTKAADKLKADAKKLKTEKDAFEKMKADFEADKLAAEELAAEK